MANSGNEALRERFTVGVEEEYQLVEPETGELRSSGGLVRRADRSGKVEAEVQDTMLEIGTPVCRDMGELAARLRERRFQAGAAASAEDLEIISAGAHPFSGAEKQVLTDSSRPRMLSGLFRHLLRQPSIWGLHIHVAIPPDLDRVILMNTVRTFGPQLLALSCSSPFSLGVDTGFSSFRSISWRGYPFVGVPPRFDSTAEYRAYLDLLLKAGMIPDERTIYWSARPNPRYPTLELRICDACPRITDAVAIAALARAIVVAASMDVLESLGDSLSPSLQDEVLRENEWIVARDGLEATLTAPERAGGKIHVRDALDEVVSIVGPISEGLGDGDALRGVGSILEGGNTADRMRDRYARTGSIQAVTDWLIEETRTGTGLDRRSHGRAEPGVEPFPTSV